MMMQHNPVMQTLFPQMTETRLEFNGHGNVSEDVMTKVCARTKRLIESLFGGDIGLDVKRINFDVCAVQMQTTANPGAVDLALNTMTTGLQDITLNSVVKFTQRDSAVFIALKTPYGTRQFIFNLIPYTFPARLIQHPETKHVMVEFIMIGAHAHRKFYCCFGEIETFRCVRCGICQESMRKCGKCKASARTVRYCSKECQLAHWPEHSAHCCR